MNSTQLRQTINHYLDRLSSDRLRLVADFLNLLVRTEHPEQTLVSETPDFRPSTGGSLLSHTETWVGEDFDECLETVYETRSQIQV